MRFTRQRGFWCPESGPVKTGPTVTGGYGPAPTLKAAKPVGAAIAHVKLSDCQIQVIKATSTSDTTDKHSKWFEVTMTFTGFVLLLVKMIPHIVKDAPLIGI